MGLRIRKSVKIAPGVRMNFGTKSGSVSVGGKGVYYNAKLYGAGKKKKSAAHSNTSGRGCGLLLYWLFIGWWWWPIRLVCYDLPMFIIKKIVAKYKKPEA